MEEYWLLLALAILFVAIFRPLRRTVLQALDGHAERVRTELEQAKRLREEAQSLLAEHQRRLASGEDQARAIVEHAQAEVRRQAERQRDELEATLKRRVELAQARIAQEEGRALQELRARTATLAIRTTERLLTEQMDAGRAKTLIDQSISEVGRKLNSQSAAAGPGA